jgi:hypothetical protein
MDSSQYNEIKLINKLSDKSIVMIEKDCQLITRIDNSVACAIAGATKGGFARPNLILTIAVCVLLLVKSL